jgi:hypothetical protein
MEIKIENQNHKEVRHFPGENPLRTYFTHNEGLAIHKWDHYLDIYHEHFKKYRVNDVVVLEIGVFQGGSLSMWSNYFGPSARIFGIDTDAQCGRFSGGNIQVFIGSQDDPVFLKKLMGFMPAPDIIIDDGGHYMRQQLTSFKYLFPWLKNNGLYLVEDLHTSYFPKYGGGYKRGGTFIEFGKSLIDVLNQWHYRKEVSTLNKTIHGLSFYDSIMIAHKKPYDNRKPLCRVSGNLSGNPFGIRKRSILQWMVYIPSRILEIALAQFRLRSLTK